MPDHHHAILLSGKSCQAGWGASSQIAVGGIGGRVSRGQKWASLPNPAFTPLSSPFLAMAQRLRRVQGCHGTHGLPRRALITPPAGSLSGNSEDPGFTVPVNELMPISFHMGQWGWPTKLPGLGQDRVVELLFPCPDSAFPGFSSSLDCRQTRPLSL